MTPQNTFATIYIKPLYSRTRLLHVGQFGTPINSNPQNYWKRSEIRRKSYNSRLVIKLPFLCSSLDLKPLSIRRRMQKLKLCFKILRKESCIPPLPTHAQPSPISSNSAQLFIPFVPTHAHKSSYFIDVIKHWNALPDEIVSAQTPLIFKNHLHRLYTCTP